MNLPRYLPISVLKSHRRRGRECHTFDACRRLVKAIHPALGKTDQLPYPEGPDVGTGPGVIRQAPHSTFASLHRNRRRPRFPLPPPESISPNPTQPHYHRWPG